MTTQEKLSIKDGVENIFSQVESAAKQSGKDANDIRIVLATKTQTPEKINYAIECGIREIGENRVQELLEKYDFINREGIKIHFIGTLQTNKVKYIIDKVDLIHSVNSIKLADEIQKQAVKHGKIMDVLVEINADDEDSKTGIASENLYELLYHTSKLSNVKVKGIMAIPPKAFSVDINHNFSTNMEQNVNILQTNDFSGHYFKKIYKIFLDISAKKIDNISMDILSLGMSADFYDAILEGSNLIRPGRAVFGERV